MGSENQIDKRKTFIEFIRNILLLHHASANAKNKPRILLLKFFNKADIPECAQLRMLTNTAGVEQDKISVLL